MSKAETNSQLSTKKNNKSYQPPTIMWLGELAKGAGDCGTGSGDAATCTDGAAAGNDSCEVGTLAHPG